MGGGHWDRCRALLPASSTPWPKGSASTRGGVYVRRWVPELAGVPDPYVHHPWDDPAGPPPGYPSPMVDHAEERAEALRRYAAVRAG